MIVCLSEIVGAKKWTKESHCKFSMHFTLIDHVQTLGRCRSIQQIRKNLHLIKRAQFFMRFSVPLTPCHCNIFIIIYSFERIFFFTSLPRTITTHNRNWSKQTKERHETKKSKIFRIVWAVFPWCQLHAIVYTAIIRSKRK